jgi:hypothetical protein
LRVLRKSTTFTPSGTTFIASTYSLATHYSTFSNYLTFSYFLTFFHYLTLLQFSRIILTTLQLPFNYSPYPPVPFPLTGRQLSLDNWIICIYFMSNLQFLENNWIFSRYFQRISSNWSYRAKLAVGNPVKRLHC